MAKLKWTVELEVEESWVADGFKLDDKRAKQMLLDHLPYAYDHEVNAKVIKTPSNIKVAKLQGYRSVAEMEEDEQRTEMRKKIVKIR